MKWYSVVLIALPALLLCSCAGEKRPAQGTPEWYYLAARDSFVTGDLEKAADHLERIERQGNNPFMQRARIWRAIVKAGVANGHLEMAQAYADGLLQTRTEKLVYTRAKADHLKEARRHAIDLVECYDACAKETLDKPLVLEFPFPKGSAAPVLELDRIYKGLNVPDALRETAQEKMRDRGVVRAVSAVLTSADDAAGAQAALKSGRAEVPPARMLLFMGVNLDKLATAFERRNLNEPDKEKLFRERAVDAAKRVLTMKPDPASEKAAKKLQADAEKALKATAKKKR